MADPPQVGDEFEHATILVGLYDRRPQVMKVSRVTETHVTYRRVVPAGVKSDSWEVAIDDFPSAVKKAKG
jgi:hypothetical protein